MKKRLLILILVFIFGFTAPFYLASAVPSVDFSYISKEFGLDLVARAISRKLLTDLSNGIITSINNLGTDQRGTKGSPTFVQNWKSFLAAAQTIGENQFRSQLNYSIEKGILCNDFKGPLAFAFQAGNVPYVDIGDPDKNAELKQNTLTSYQTKVRCTIPDKTREEFKKDFEKGGGWNTWSRMLEPQNNLSGATLLSIEELQKQRASQQEAQGKEAVAGQGFKGVKSACQQATPAQARDTLCYRNCQSNIPLSIPIAERDSYCLNQCKGQTAVGANAQCTFQGKTVTPAKILGEGASEFLDSNAKWFVSSDELSEVLISIVGAAVNKLSNFGPANLLIEELQQQPVPSRIKKGLEETEKEGPLPLNSYCSENSECQSGVCGTSPGINSRVCIERKLSPGSSCSNDTQCNSNFCADGFCE